MGRKGCRIIQRVGGIRRVSCRVRRKKRGAVGSTETVVGIRRLRVVLDRFRQYHMRHQLVGDFRSGRRRIFSSAHRRRHPQHQHCNKISVTKFHLRPPATDYDSSLTCFLLHRLREACDNAASHSSWFSVTVCIGPSTTTGITPPPCDGQNLPRLTIQYHPDKRTHYLLIDQMARRPR